MDRDDLADAVAGATGTGKAEAAEVVGAVLDAIRESLGKGEKVSVSGFGSFEVSDRPEREGRNPRTGANIKIAASKAVMFRAGKGLKDAVNGGGR